MSIFISNRVQGPGETVYCGRGSALGNPFVMQNLSDTERNRVCDKYEEWFQKLLTKTGDMPFLIQLHTIRKLAQKGDVTLQCFCAPKRCHCETIKKYIEGETDE